MDKEEDLKSINPGMDKIISDNDKISDNFRELAKQCFGRIFYTLGEKNFKRWLDMKQIRTQVRELIIESMDKKEIENAPTTAGYYVPRKNRIALNKNQEKEALKAANVHETFHLLSDGRSEFGIFMDEGLTEYMKTLAFGKTTAYGQNVRTVAFLHKMLGDSLIKSYLMGGKKGLDTKVLEMVNFDEKTSPSDITEFYGNLDKFHEYMWERDENIAFRTSGATPEIVERSNQRLKNARLEYEKSRPEIVSMYTKIIVGRISEMSKNLEFYKNGTLDLEFASKQIKELVNSANITDFILPTDMIPIAEWKTQAMRLAAEQVLENSHILMGYGENEREARKKELIEKIVPPIIATKNQITMQSATIKNTDILPEENTNITSKLFEKFLTDDMNITQYIETVARIIQHTCITDNRKIEDALNRYNIQYFGNISKFRDINSLIISSIPKIQKLNELQEERRRNTIASEYKSIGNGRFIEKRDNQIFYVELDEDGTFKEQEVNFLGKTIFLKNGQRLDIDCSKGLSNLEARINNQIVKLGEPLSLQDVKDKELADTFSKDIKDSIISGKYTKILNDAENPWEIKGVSYSADIDKRSRAINFYDYIQDLKNIISIIPESQKDNFIKESTKLLLDKTYRIPKNFESQTVNELYNLTVSKISTLINSDNSKEDSINYNILENNAKRFQSIRTKMVEENETTAVIFFKDKTVEKEYRKFKESKKIKPAIEKQKYVQEASSKFNYKDFYSSQGEVPVDELPFYLSGVSTTQLIDTRCVTFSYNQFATALKETILRYPVDVRNDIFNKIFNIQMQKTYYLLGENDFSNPNIKDALENVRSIISEKVFLGKEIDEEQISSELDILNNFKVEKAKYGQKVAAVHFRDNSARERFFGLKNVIDMIKKSGLRDGMIEKEAQDLIRLQSQSKENEIGTENLNIKE